MKPHEIARLVQEESQQLVPDQGRIDGLVEDLADLVGLEDASRLLRQNQAPIRTVH